MIIEQISKQNNFDTFIQEEMKTSTYKSESKNEFISIDHEPSKSYQAFAAAYAAAMAGSIVDKNANKPQHSLPKADTIIGAISRIADEWQMDNDLLDHYLYLEGRYKSRYSTYTEEQRIAEYKKLCDYLFKPYELAVIAPWKRVDMIYFEGLYNGTRSVSLTNNSKSGVTYSIDLGTKKFKTLTAKWGEANATPIDDIEQIVRYAESIGKTVLKIRMPRSTYAAMCKATQIASNFTLVLSKSRVVAQNIVPISSVNEYLESLGLPQIEIEKPKMVTLPDGTSYNMIPTNRAVFMLAEKVAVLKVAESVEAVDRLPNKQYSVYDDNLVGQYRNSEGRFIDYEMWATPVFTGKKDYIILNADEVTE